MSGSSPVHLDDFRLVFDFVVDDIERRIDAVVQICHHPFLGCIYPREILQVLDDVPHPRNSILGFGHQRRDVFLEVVEFNFVAQRFKALCNRCTRQRRLRFFVGSEHLEQVAQIALQSPEVGKDETDRVVDFVCNAGGKLPDGRHLFRLHQFVLGI